MKRHLVSENHLRSIIDSAIEGIVIVNAVGRIEYVNPSALKIFGYQKKSELNGKNIRMLMPSAFHSKHDDYIDKHLEGGVAKTSGLSRETEGKRKDGTELSIWLSVTEYIEDGKKYFTNLIKDISHLQHCIAKVKSYEHIFEKSLNEIYIFDAVTLRFLHANQGALDNLLYTLEEITKLTPVDIKPEYTTERFHQLIKPLLKGENNQIVFTTTHRRKDGSKYPVEAHLELSEYDSSNVIVAIILDITKRKYIEDELRLSKEEFELIFENAPTGIAVLDLDGYYKNVNPALCDILGYSKKELLKLSYKDITHPDDLETSDEYLNKLLRGDFSGFTIDKRYIRKDKKIINVSLSVAIVQENITLAHDDIGKPLLLISHIFDKTEQLNIEDRMTLQQEQLAHMDRISMMGEMAAGIAHEINQPLTAIDTYSNAASQRLQSNNFDKTKVQELLEKISKASLRAGNVITQLRSLVKRKVRQFETYNLNKLLEDTVQLAETYPKATLFTIRLKLATELPDVSIDIVQIQQVILNLIQNAMDASEHVQDIHPEITITSTYVPQDKKIQISVRDLGIGIDKEAEKHLFDPFFTTKSSGMGMGLPISKSIIQLHGGNLWFTRNSTTGCTFCFTLPTIINKYD